MGNLDLWDDEEDEWSIDHKRAYLWDSLVRTAQSAESNTFYYRLITVKAGEGDHVPTLLPRSEQKSILGDFALEKKIKIIPIEFDFDNPNIDPDDAPDPYVLHIQLNDNQSSRKSAYSNSIPSFSDLVKDMKLRAEVQNLLTGSFGVYDIREIRENQNVEIDIEERKDELLLLLEELEFLKINWESLKQQTHRMIGNRYLRVYFFGKQAKRFADALFGRSSVVRPQALEQVAYMIKDTTSQAGLSDAFLQIGVPYSLLMDNNGSKKEVVYNILSALSSTGDEEDTQLFFKILEEFSHPLMFGGNTKSAVDFQYKLTKVIRYDGLSILGGKMHEFNGDDEKQMTELEKQELELSQEMGSLFTDIFGGNPFGGSKQEAKTDETKQESKAAEPKETHIHIYNNNNNSQTVTVPTTSSQEQSIDTKPKESGLAPNLDWSEIEIKFEDGHEVTIKYGDDQKRSDYKEMGFEDTTQRKPNTQWQILKHMAEHNGFISFDDSTQYTRSMKSQKKELSQKLKEYFGIQKDPIEYQDKGYFAIFTLRPEKEAPTSFLPDF